MLTPSRKISLEDLVILSIFVQRASFKYMLKDKNVDTE